MVTPPPRWTIASLTVAIVLAGPAARAQVNVETLRSDLKDKPWFATVSASMTARMGNVNGIIAGASLFSGMSAGRHLLFLKAQGDYAKFNTAATVSRSFAHVRYNFELTDRVFGEIFSQIQQDKFQKLTFRYLQGIGPRFALIEENVAQAYMGTAYMFEYEELSPDITPSSNDVSPAHRWSNYLSLALRVSSRARLTSVVYVQPRFDDLTDFRVLSDSLLKVEITDRLSSQIGLLVRYDSKPPIGVKHTDVETRTSFALTF